MCQDHQHNPGNPGGPAGVELAHCNSKRVGDSFRLSHRQGLENAETESKFLEILQIYLELCEGQHVTMCTEFMVAIKLL